MQDMAKKRGTWGGDREGAGRPPAAPEDKRRPFQVKLTEDERADIDRAAAKSEKPASTWVRDVVLKAARRLLGKE
jgi:uncharacterized protein (DUF1778 family)